MSNFAQIIGNDLMEGWGMNCETQKSGLSPDPTGASEARPPRTYESPQVIIIGKISDITTGNASSGNTDANSQYYW
jgi:hypothetical protein